MHDYFVNLSIVDSNITNIRSIPVRLTPHTHPLVFLMGFISDGENRAFTTLSSDTFSLPFCSKNQINVFFFINEFWKTDPSKCVDFLIRTIKYIRNHNLDFYDGFGFSPEEIISALAPHDIYLKNPEKKLEKIIRTFYAPSVSHVYFKRVFTLISNEIPELYSTLLERIGSDIRRKLPFPDIEKN